MTLAGNVPLVSVIMAAWRTDQTFFEEAVNSILEQTFDNFELLLVDDGLSDENRSWLASVSDARLKIIVNKENLGQSKSVNKALSLARGKYVIRMDADDVATPMRIGRQVAYMEGNPMLIAAGAQVRILGSSKIRPRPFSSKKELLATFAFKTPLVHPTMIIRLDALRENSIRYNEQILYAQDYMFWVDLISVGDIALQPEVVLEYRIHDRQITSKQNVAQMAYASQARHKYLLQAGVEASLRDAKLIGEIANGILTASNSEYDEVCELLIRSSERDNVSLDVRWVRKLVASHVLRSVLYGLKSPGGFKRLVWGRFWAALFSAPYWPYYIKSKF